MGVGLVTPSCSTMASQAERVSTRHPPARFVKNAPVVSSSQLFAAGLSASRSAASTFLIALVRADSSAFESSSLFFCSAASSVRNIDSMASGVCSTLSCRSIISLRLSMSSVSRSKLNRRGRRASFWRGSVL